MIESLDQRLPMAASLVKDINTIVENGHNIPSNPREMIEVNGTLYFSANDGTHGIELWKSDGTTAGKVMVRDIKSDSWMRGSYPEFLTNVKGTLYFSADDGIHGNELWRLRYVEPPTDISLSSSSIAEKLLATQL